VRFLLRSASYGGQVALLPHLNLHLNPFLNGYTYSTGLLETQSPPLKQIA